MSVYIIEEHGDALEKLAAAFIRQTIPYYERVWQLYIGHQGNGVKADIPGYELSELRDRFSEHTYTILESAYVMYTIIQSEIFETPVDSIQGYLEFNKSFISFFAHLGRIKDNLARATDVLMNDRKKIEGELDAFFQARNIILHGRKIPFNLDELGLIKIPLIFSMEGENSRAWDDKINTWPHFSQFRSEYAASTVEKLFDELMKIVNTEFTHYYNFLMYQLKTEKASLQFVYNSNPNTFTPSGTTAVMISQTAVSSSAH